MTSKGFATTQFSTTTNRAAHYQARVAASSNTPSARVTLRVTSLEKLRWRNSATPKGFLLGISFDVKRCADARQSIKLL